MKIWTVNDNKDNQNKAITIQAPGFGRLTNIPTQQGPVVTAKFCGSSLRDCRWASFSN